MPLFPGIGAAVKIGGKALGAIVSKAKKKRAEKKLARAERRANEKELEFGALANKLGIAQAPGTRIGSLIEGSESSIKKSLEKIKPIATVSAKGFTIGVSHVVVAVIALLALIFIFRKNKR